MYKNDDYDDGGTLKVISLGNFGEANMYINKWNRLFSKENQE